MDAIPQSICASHFVCGNKSVRLRRLDAQLALKSSVGCSLTVYCQFANNGGRHRSVQRHGRDSVASDFNANKRRGVEKEEEKGDRFMPSRKQRRATHKILQVLEGTVRRRKLLSPTGMHVRPMMEVVRGAAFSILQVAGGCPFSLQPGRWLDLYCGTGSVGIEAMSRGCTKAHFVELDPWVVSEVLRPNLVATGFIDLSVIHAVHVETFLARAEQFLGINGQPFNYISVTPPYTTVNYDKLMKQLANSPLLGEDTFIVVEYPLEVNISGTCGNLVMITNRRFGRTVLVIYGPERSRKK